MSRKIQLRPLAFALAVAGALTFGMGGALAEARAEMRHPTTCPWVRTGEECMDCCGDLGVEIYDGTSCVCNG